MNNSGCISNKKQQILEKWYKGDVEGKSLIQKVTQDEMKRVGGLAQMDEDNFYSLANEVFFRSLKSWDEERSFKIFFRSNLRRKISTEIRNMNRKKRGGFDDSSPRIVYNDENDPTGEKRYRENERRYLYQSNNNVLSLDYNIDEETSMHDIVSGGDNIQEYIDGIEEHSDEYNNFMDSCSRMQKKILEFKMNNLGCREKDICEALNISSKVYHQHMEDILFNPYLFQLQRRVSVR